MTPLDAALAYAARGWHVFPIWPIRDGRCSCGKGADCEHPGKHPVGALVPRGDHDATLDVGRIRHWWSEIPDANVAVALEPSGLTVLDVDVADGKSGRASLEQLQGEMHLPDTLCSQTGRGGLHGIYATRGEPSRRIGYRLGIDILGKGYAVLPPSRNTGGEYRWLNNLEPAPMPDFAAHDTKQQRTPISDSDRIPDGQRNSVLASMAGKMRHNGHTEAEILAALRAVNAARCVPPMADDEVAKIAWSIARYAPNEQPVEAASFAAALQAIRGTPLEQTPTSTRAPWAWEAMAADKPPVIAFPTGIREFDRLTTGGVATGQVSAWLGPPGAGKSNLLLCLTLQLDHLRPVLVVQTELEAHEAGARMGASLLDVPWVDVTDGRVPKSAVLEPLRKHRVRVVGCDKVAHGVPGLTQVAHEAVAMRAENDGVSPIIVLDYLQDFARGGSADETRHRVDGMAGMLRQLAQELETHVAVVSSVSRGFYDLSKKTDRDDPVVWLSAAKESGGVDYAAALVTGVEVGPRVDGQTWKWARLALAKVRRGETGYVGMRFYGASGRWVEDPAALAHMALEQRGEQHAIATARSDDDKVLERVCALPEPLAKRALRAVCGIGAGRADASISRLLASGVLTAMDVITPDGLGRPVKRQVIGLPISSSTTPKNGSTHRPLLADVRFPALTTPGT